MALRLRDLLVGSFAELRVEPTARRVRATLDGEIVVESQRAMLVWESRHVVPYYAVPAEDVRAELRPVPVPADADSQLVTLAPEGLAAGAVSIVRPGSFTRHTVGGEELSIRFAGGDRHRAAFRFTDPDLSGYIGLDFGAFDAWFEEDTQIVAHPRDPFHRVDVLRSSRRVRVESGGRVLAESTRPRLLFETHLPVRFYLPPEDVTEGLLRPSATRTTCAYKGEATYWSLAVEGGTADVAWSYPRPLAEAADIAGMIAFFDEHVDVVLDGQRRERPRTPWSASGS
ncbi:DUF427 domain-containing protein [Micromonospora sp. NPDC007271]|uniref:DUF427 domain-containing protein n=1 Tax=Micromonospora sp. NPDC007271 TaxID=3154587 RepID=UPI003400D40A